MLPAAAYLSALWSQPVPCRRPGSVAAAAAAGAVHACVVSQVQVTQVFARRGYNVQSLAVGPSETPGDSRITMVVPGTRDSVDKIIKQVRIQCKHW